MTMSEISQAFPQYWDCSGTERFMRLTSRYAAGVVAVIFVFNGKRLISVANFSLTKISLVNNRYTFDSLERWLSEVEKHTSCEFVKSKSTTGILCSYYKAKTVYSVLVGNESEIYEGSRTPSTKVGGFIICPFTRKSLKNQIPTLSLEQLE